MNNNYIYKINEIKEEEFKEFQSKGLDNTKFFYKSLNEKIKYYRYKDFIYLDFFEKVYFRIDIEGLELNIVDFDSNSLKEKNRKLKKENDYYSLYISKNELNLNDEQISYLLRGSKSLKFLEFNTYKNVDIEVTFSENTFVCKNNFDNSKSSTKKAQLDKFLRINILYLLAHVYNMYTERLMYEVSKSLDNEQNKKMLELRRDIYIFDLKYFFYNPIDYRWHQLYNIWPYLKEIYSVEHNHREMKSQVEDLVNLIEFNNRDIEKKEKEEKRLEEEKRYRKIQEDKDKERKEEERRYRKQKDEYLKEKEKDEERRNLENLEFNKKTKRLTKIAIAIALISLVSAYKDFEELGGVKYIKSIISNEKIENKTSTK
ncbi:hypothetical protein [Arcobacter roscoffensis]|uniref:Uncharacterized protein n=1 Tax=Arcobacter roscoffensis TaxID=2961520 RepID=A0ABY5E2C2_9BACT|nr:hypothetical protein [Arcobacter roscoffensis]UTJ05709.1 hypothetical protein NJU99_10600 [Arcobacter roscoffensis]